jgi:hypothetical protein
VKIDDCEEEPCFFGVDRVGLGYFQKTAQGYSQYVQPIRSWLVNQTWQVN